MNSLEVIVWKDGFPYLTTNTPEYLLKSDKALAMIYDELYHRLSWTVDLNEWLNEVKQQVLRQEWKI